MFNLLKILNFIKDVGICILASILSKTVNLQVGIRSVNLFYATR